MSADRSSFSAERNGVYGVAGDAAACRRIARPCGLASLEVDLAGATDKACALCAFAEGLALPREFGANWDALADALQDFSWRPASGYVIEVRNAGALAAASSEDCRTVLDILQEAALYWKGHGKPFVVLVHGLPGLPPFSA